MAGWNEAYPYRAPFPRTGAWYDGDWQKISSWCDRSIGPGLWEYFNSEFRFAEEKGLMMFTLKWSSDDYHD